MHNIIRFYNQNREKIIKIILIIVFIFGIIQFFNYLAKIKLKNNKNNVNPSNVITNNLDNSKDYLASNKSIISGGNVSDTKLDNDTKIIKTFMDFCNNKEVTKAYNLLTDECKEVMFPTEEDFYKIYYYSLFGKQEKTYTIENWSKNTYYILMTDEMLSTGKVNENKTNQDYITIVKQDNDEYKININNYIGRKKINKQQEEGQIEVTIENKDIYMDYEIYNLKIKNNLENTILLSTTDDTKSIYLLDSKDMKYYFYANEIPQNKLVISKGITNNLQIKFNSSYSSSRTMEKMIFSKVILNYNEYMKLEDKTQYKDIYKLEINV